MSHTITQSREGLFLEVEGHGGQGQEGHEGYRCGWGGRSISRGDKTVDDEEVYPEDTITVS